MNSFFQNIKQFFSNAPSGSRSATPLQLSSKRLAKRTLPAASFNRLTPADWKNLSSLEQMMSSNWVIRERARDLEKTNDFAEKFLKEVEANIPGPKGFTFQSNVRELKKQKQKDGSESWIWAQDVVANSKIEEAYADFSKAKNFMIDAQASRSAAEKLLARMWMRDGEAFVRAIPNANAKHGCNFMILESEAVDESLNTVNKVTGNIIKMGVEIDSFRRPVTYYIRRRTTSSELWGSNVSVSDHDAIPAEQMFHLFTKKYPNQTRGISEMVQSMVRLKRLSDYEDAVLVNAQITAAKMGFFSDKDSENPDDLTLGAGMTETDDEGNEYTSGDQSMDVSAGSFEDIGGKQFTPFSPEFPSQQHEMVVKTTMHAVSAGLGESYAMGTNDLGDTSYSSARVGLLDERELWKMRQAVFIEKISEPQFEFWIKFAILAGSVSLPISKLEKFSQPVFVGRRWGWVDPLKDIMADALAVEYGFSTRTQLLAERGQDIQEVNAELAQEQADAENAGIKLKFHEGAVIASEAKQSPDPNADNETPNNKKKQSRTEQEEIEDRILMQSAALLLNKKSNGHKAEVSS